MEIKSNCFLFGDAIYEVIIAVNKKPFELGAHLTRLKKNISSINAQNFCKIIENDVFFSLEDENLEDDYDLILGRNLATTDSRQGTVATLLNLTAQPINLFKALSITDCALIETGDIAINSDPAEDSDFGEEK